MNPAKPKVILLAAGRGRRFGKRTERLPKCLIPLSPKGDNLLGRTLDSFEKLGLRDIVIVVGHEREKIMQACTDKSRGLSLKFLVNHDFKKGSIVSLFTARKEFSQDVLIMDADVFFETAQLKKLARARHSSFLIDPKSRSAGEEMMVMAEKGRIVRIAKKIDAKLDILGEATGFLKLKKADATLLDKILKQMVQNGKTGAEYEDSYNELMKTRKLGFVKISGFWREMDFEKDLTVIVRQRRTRL